MSYEQFFAEAYGADPWDQFGADDPWDQFGALNVGNKQSSKRNQAFSILKRISTAIGHSRSFSASRFRAMTRPQAANARLEVANALKSFARANGISLQNSGAPLMTYTTAEANLDKVRDSGSAVPEPEPETTEEEEVVEPTPEYDPWVDPGGLAPATPPPLWDPPGTVGPPATYPGQPGTSGFVPAVRPPPPAPVKSFWASPWVWGGLIAGFGVLGLGAFLIFRGKEPEALQAPSPQPSQVPLGAQNYYW